MRETAPCKDRCGFTINQTVGDPAESPCAGGRTASLDRLTNYNLLNSDDNAVHVSVMDAISKTYILVKDKISHEYKTGSLTVFYKKV